MIVTIPKGLQSFHAK